MKIKPSFSPKILCLLVTGCLFTSCVKTDDLDLDTKVRFVNAVDGKAQDFYLNTARLSTGITYSSNSNYIVAAGNKDYAISAKNTGTQSGAGPINAKLAVGKNYSVYYYRNSVADSLLRVLEDDLTPDTANARIFFINLGYSLGSKVNIRNETSNPLNNNTLGNGETLGYIKMPVGKNSKLYFNLLDSVNVVDTISSTNFFKGKTYTIIIDGITNGASKGKLKTRLLLSN